VPSSSGRHRKVVLTEPAKVHLLKCKVCSKRRRIDSEAHSKASASSAPVAAVLVEVVSVEEEAEEGAGKISRLMVVEPASSKGGVVPSDDYQIRFQKPGHKGRETALPDISSLLLGSAASKEKWGNLSIGPKSNIQTCHF
jgi:hypothetical protein